VAAKKKFGPERDVIYVPKPAKAFITAREHSFVRPNKFDTPRFEFFDVFLRGVMLPHFSIHGRRDQNGRARGERDRRQRMTRQTVCKFGDDVRGGWRDQDQVCAIREINVARPPVFFLIVEGGRHRIFGKRLQRER